MSSTTPGQGSREGGSDVNDEREGTTRREPPATKPGRDASAAPRSGGSSGATGPDRPAMRTSLAERFAAAKGDADQSGAPGRGSDPTATAPLAPTGGGRAPGTTRQPPRPPDRERREGARTDTQPGAAPAPRPPGGTSRPAREPARDAGATPREDASGQEPVTRPLGPRQVRLSLARVDPWSVMKLAFLLAIAVGIGIVVATAAMWYVLDTMHVFADVQALLDSLGSESFINLMEYAQFDRVISMAAIVAVVDIVLLTALATLGAFLYNIVAALVGGLHLTLTDD